LTSNCLEIYKTTPTRARKEKGKNGEKMERDEHDKEGNMKTSEEGIENSRQ
jgi:hypothetical protein